ncbi:hypothetical protein D9613_010764 [Agrocybe pediades]|uniref:GPI-anchored wall transfer protein 1 n=1 Tax=Agrocybe pediades TaxID=84607 RepID=A0A8H4VM80_9AGAR|nr:hypothetical protein D9613_010764 [Agrocybe pediades]
MDSDYKQAKEEFVSGMTGSSITYINLISLVALSAVSLYALIRTRLPPTREIGFFFSWTILVLPMLLGMSLAANHPLYLNLLLLLAIALITRLWPRVESGTPLPLPSSQPASPSLGGRSPAVGVGAVPHGLVQEERDGKRRGRMSPLPALTTYRAHMMLMTVLAILAVDFPVFPRSLAKCETFGVSLMDLGVGSFVFSQGIVSAIPLVKDAAHLRAPLLPKLVSVTKKCVPVIALGVVRVLLVKGTEYPEHVTEYGVHWNFFITLALLPILQVILHPVFLRLPIGIVGFLVALLQQVGLTKFGMKEYVLSAHRTNLLSQNKEGIISLLGYLSIQLLGLSIGTIILPPTPSFFKRRQKAFLEQHSETRSHKRRNSNSEDNPFLASSNRNATKKDNDVEEFDIGAPRQLDKTATELCAYAILWWTFLGLTRLLKLDGRWNSDDGGVSRRMVNISYILWVVAFNVSFLLCYVVVLDLWIYADNAQTSSAAKSQLKKQQQQAVKQGGIGAGSSSPSRYAQQLNVDSPEFHQSQTQLQGQFYYGNQYSRSGSNSVVGSSSTLSLSAGNVHENPPLLLEAINAQGLPVFLLANVLTGLVNFSMSTMYMSDGRAMTVLAVYSMVCCGVPWIWTKWTGGTKTWKGKTN